MKIHQGIDLLKIERIEKIFNRFSNKFLEKTFSKNELNQIHEIKINKTNKIASKFSVKEAVGKALGTGISKGISLKDIEVLNLQNGKPTIILHKKAKNVLKNIVSFDVSISHDSGFVISIVTFLTID
tara:strand:- start:1720 stop:2100 length:381 start_codon:yes stop_codon:yes gene_type:complete